MGLASTAMRRSAATILPAVALAASACVMMSIGSAFVPAPSHSQQAPRFLEASVVSAGATVLASAALPAIAEEIDAAEAYNRKVMTGAAYGLTLSFILLGIIISRARKLVENRWLN